MEVWAIIVLVCVIVWLLTAHEKSQARRRQHDAEEERFKIEDCVEKTVAEWEEARRKRVAEYADLSTLYLRSDAEQATLAQAATLRSCMGIPPDLIMTADLAYNVVHLAEIKISLRIAELDWRIAKTKLCGANRLGRVEEIAWREQEQTRLEREIADLRRQVDDMQAQVSSKVRNLSVSAVIDAEGRR